MYTLVRLVSLRHVLLEQLPTLISSMIIRGGVLQVPQLHTRVPGISGHMVRIGRLHTVFAQDLEGSVR